jgi:DNA-directed RNA polymerase subunit RPC12/RpoP
MRSQIKPTDLFQTSAGALLLAMASALFLINITSPVDLITPHDPILGLSTKILFWTVGGIAFSIALDCLFGNRLFRPMLLLAWLVTSFLVYRIGLVSLGSHGLTGFLNGFSDAFGIPAKIASGLVQTIWGYLFAGSYCAVWCLARQRKLAANRLPTESKLSPIQRSNDTIVRTLKISCTACGGRIEFPTNAFGEKISCPHCHASITLQKPKNVKMVCPSCDGHIEFPDYAVGQRVACPHCKIGIILKEPA